MDVLKVNNVHFHCTKDDRHLSKISLHIDNFYKPWIGICHYGVLSSKMEAISLLLGPASSATAAFISFVLIKKISTILL